MPPAPVRLDGWKEIASYFGRGVRTVQRWEAELRLPVRRIGTGRGQVTYAFVEELERWRESVSANKDVSGGPGGTPDDIPAAGDGDGLDAHEQANGGKPRARIRAVAGALAGALAVAVLGGAAWIWFAGRAATGAPDSARVTDNALSVFDSAGRLLWTHRFGFPLTESSYGPAAPGKNYASVVVGDVDGDGSAEVLFVAEPWLPGGRGLFCFNSNGSIRFQHQAARVVKFGEKTYAPPWRGVSVYVSGQPGRPRDIWFVSTHLEEFPTMLEKLDAAGRIGGEYWSNGQITTVVFAEAGGRRLVFVGGISNEYKGASLAVLDDRHPFGSAPAASDHYRCRGCPAGSPLAFMVFPRLDLTAAIDTHAHVTNVFVDRLGQVLVNVLHHVGDEVPQELRWSASTQYRLDGQFRVTAAELGERLPQIHRLFEREGLLDHPFSRERDERYLWPVRRWQGSGFAEVAGLEVRSPR